ncbi:MAG: hypothetical protein P4M02_05650 [Clostridia bacterium]|nr:hypothetical protein [Clostridia bacterium]
MMFQALQTSLQLGDHTNSTVYLLIAALAAAATVAALIATHLNKRH